MKLRIKSCFQYSKFYIEKKKKAAVSFSLKYWNVKKMFLGPVCSIFLDLTTSTHCILITKEKNNNLILTDFFEVLNEPKETFDLYQLRGFLLKWCEAALILYMHLTNEPILSIQDTTQS